MTVDHQSHYQGGDVPAAGDQAAKWTLAGELSILVKRLRIITRSELDDLRFTNFYRVCLRNLPDCKIFKIPFRAQLSSVPTLHSPNRFDRSRQTAASIC